MFKLDKTFLLQDEENFDFNRFLWLNTTGNDHIINDLTTRTEPHPSTMHEIYVRIFIEIKKQYENNRYNK